MKVCDSNLASSALHKVRKHYSLRSKARKHSFEKS